MQDTRAVLQIERILLDLSSFAQTEKGRAEAQKLGKMKEDALKEELSFMVEANDLLSLAGRMPLVPLNELGPIIELAKKGGTLKEGDLTQIASMLKALRDTKRFFAKNGNPEKLVQLLAYLGEEEDLVETIERTIGPNLEVLDRASTDLKRIRSTIARLTKELSTALPGLLSKYQAYLGEGASFVMREGHYVLPVADSFKNKVKGIVYGVSNSGATTFIEPFELVDKENKIAALRYEEREEILRILFSISKQVGSRYENLSAVYEAIVYLDLLQAKILYGEKIHGHLASLSPEGDLYIPEARHPLLEERKVVANTFSLSSQNRVLVISGPNAGGKTVALKTVGVACYLFHLGMMVPCSLGAEIPYFKRILVDIGDSQSIEASLSTFSGHISGIADILRQSGGRDLVLLDEIGTGTSPKEGEALAIAIVEELLHKHSYAFVSSHFEGLKAYAMASKFIENASMGIDPDTFLPTFQLRLGIPGESYGLKVASRLGLPKEVIDNAEKRLGDSSSRGALGESLAKLSRLAKENEALQEDLKKKQAALEKKERDLRNLEHDLKRKKDNYLETVKEEKSRLLEEARAKIDEALAPLREGAKPHVIMKAKGKLRDLEEAAPEPTRYQGEIALGDYVLIPDYDIEGLVVRASGNKITIESAGGASYTIDRDRAVKTEKPEPKKEAESGMLLDMVGVDSLSLELNIIGLRVEEAKEELAEYLDRCRLKGFKRVRIIHGFGTGALRKMTDEYLNTHRHFVESYERAGEHEGGSGATIVHLK